MKYFVVFFVVWLHGFYCLCNFCCGKYNNKKIMTSNRSWLILFKGFLSLNRGEKMMRKYVILRTVLNLSSYVSLLSSFLNIWCNHYVWLLEVKFVAQFTITDLKIFYVLHYSLSWCNCFFTKPDILLPKIENEAFR